MARGLFEVECTFPNGKVSMKTTSKRPDLATFKSYEEHICSLVLLVSKNSGSTHTIPNFQREEWKKIICCLDRS